MTKEYADCSLQQMDEKWFRREVSREIVEEFVKIWNASHHYSRATVYEFSIGNRLVD